MKYKVYVSLQSIRGRVEIDVELDNNLTEEEVEEELRDTAFEEVDWNYEIVKANI